jgi:DNA-damage-inducible protein D
MADFLPTITIKAKDFANEITNFSIKRDYLHTEAQITRELVKNNREIRKLLSKRKIKPEELPPAEDVKKIARRLTSEEKALPRETKLIEPPAGSSTSEQQLIFDPGDTSATRRNGKRPK